MLNILQQLFGGSSQQSTSQSLPQNMNPFTNMLAPQVGSLAGSMAGGLPQYGGPLNAPMSGNEGNLLTQLMTQQGQGGGVAGTNDYLTKVLSGSFLPGQPGGNPFLQDAITAAQRTTTNNLDQTLSRSLPGYFTANGHMIAPNSASGNGGSSAFDTAAAIATRGAATAMGDIATNMSNTAYGQERTNQQQAVQLSQQEVQNTVSNLQAQSLPRMIQELGIERGMSLFQTNLSGMLQLLQSIGGIAQPVVGNSQTSTSKGESQGNAFASMFPATPAKAAAAG